MKVGFIYWLSLPSWSQGPRSHIVHLHHSRQNLLELNHIHECSFSTPSFNLSLLSMPLVNVQFQTNEWWANGNLIITYPFLQHFSFLLSWLPFFGWFMGERVAKEKKEVVIRPGFGHSLIVKQIPSNKCHVSWERNCQRDTPSLLKFIIHVREFMRNPIFSIVSLYFV